MGKCFRILDNVKNVNTKLTSTIEHKSATVKVKRTKIKCTRQNTHSNIIVSLYTGVLLDRMASD